MCVPVQLEQTNAARIAGERIPSAFSLNHIEGIFF
jgi:hypothetical protein